MLSCSHDDCSWRPVAPSKDAARQQLAEHVVEEHSRSVDVDIPDGKIEVKFEKDGEWMTVTAEEANQLYEQSRDD